MISHGNGLDILDPLLFVPHKCHDLIFQHLHTKSLLNLSYVSRSWTVNIARSSAAMERTFFNYNHESKAVFDISSREYQNIKVKQSLMNQAEDFLLKLLKFFPNLQSLSFEGIFPKEMIEKFSEERQKIMNTTPYNFKLKHLQFIGNVENISLLFSEILNLGNKVVFESIELIDVPSEVFSNIFKYLRAKKLVLHNMNIRKLSRYDICYQIDIEQLEMLHTTVDEVSAEFLRECCCSLKNITVDEWKRFHEPVRRLLVNSEFSRVEVKKVSLPYIEFTMHIVSDLHRLVFQHLSCEELLKSSEVSKLWFNETKEIIEKNTVFDSFNCNLESRKRSYRNILATVDTEMGKMLSFADNLTELYLEVTAESMVNVNSLFSTERFCKLNLLKIAYKEQNSSTLDDLTLPESLRILHLTNFTLSSENTNQTNFFKFLCNSKILSELKFFQSFGIEKLFDTDVTSKFEFRLKTLKLPLFKRIYEIRPNFERFLESQSKSLEHLSLCKISMATIQRLGRGFNLKSFGFLYVEGQRIGDLAPIFTLTDFQLPQLKGNNSIELEDLKYFMKLAPNMKIVHVYRLYDRILHHLRDNFKFLEEVRYGKKYLKTLKKEIIDRSFNGINLIEGDITFEEFADNIVR